MRVLVTGAQGQVGAALARSVPAEIELHALTRAQLDITDAAAVGAAVSRLNPALIVNAAAYTAVDRAESQPGEAARVNADGPCRLAAAARGLGGCRMLQLSTDYVFDGRSRRPYRPEDPTAPQSVYGRTKLEGERAVRSILADRALILRSAWIYAAAGHNFLLTMLRRMREQGSVRVVADQRGSPTAVDSVARAIWRIVGRWMPRQGRDGQSPGAAPAPGTLHWSDAGTASWYEFACAIAEEALAAGLLSRAAEVTPIATSEYPTPAQRPAYSVLDTSETARWLGLEPIPWRVSLRETLGQVRAASKVPPAPDHHSGRLEC